MSKEELIARGHAILDEAPRDYSAITNLVVDALNEGYVAGWVDGANQHGEYVDEDELEDLTIRAESRSPYREELA